MSKDRLTHEQRELLRSQIDQARRKIRRLNADGRPPTELQQNTADQIAPFLAADPERAFSVADISQALGYSLDRVSRALGVLENQQRATAIQVGRYTRWKAQAGRV